MSFFSSTTQQVLEVGPHAAWPMSDSSSYPCDLATVHSPCSSFDEKKYQILTIIPAELKEYPVNS